MEQLAPAETKIADCDYLPEVTQFAKLAKAVYTKHCFDQAKCKCMRHMDDHFF